MRNVRLLLGMLFVSVVSNSAHAQLADNGSRLTVQVWNPWGGNWTSHLDGVIGNRVEWRVVASYVGTNTSVVSLGSVAYQPVISPSDNTGPVYDFYHPFRNGGFQGNSIAGSMLTAAEGNDGGPLPSYGRVTYGATADRADRDPLTVYRHGGDFPQNGAPLGNWARIAAGPAANWPVIPTPLELVGAGVFSSQASRVNPVTGQVNPFHVGGTQGLVLFRGATTFNEYDLEQGRFVTIGIAPESLRRTSATDEVGYMSWQTGDFDSGNYRVGVVVQSATINLTPSPGAVVLLASAGMVATRRRR